MKKLTINGARKISTAIIILLVSVIACFAILPEKTVSIVGGESYAPIYNGSRNKAEVALMFNVYEATDIVNGILDVLDTYQVKCTFFVGGCWADDNNETLERIVSCGHEIANHGYFHLNHKNLNEADNLKEISNNHNVVKGITGVDMKLFAPPSGAFNTSTLICAEKLGYKTIMWTKDTIDWRDKDEKLVFKRATNDIQNGDLVLMHPKQHTLNALDDILEFYKEKNIRAVTVTECIKEND